MLMKYDKPPDGGWGWMVVLNGFISYGVVWPIPRSFAVLFADFMLEFGTNKADTSWITSLMFGFAALGSLPGSFLTILIGGRLTVIIGGLLSFVGLIMISQCSTIFIAYLGSLIAGLGFGFSYANATPQIGLYFDQKRAFATSIAALGTPATGVFMPVLLGFLQELYGWRGAVMIFAAYSLHISVGGCLLRPVYVKSLADSEKKKTDSSEDCEGAEKPPEVEVKESGCAGLAGYLELLRNWRFVLFMVHGFQDFCMRLSVSWFIVLYVTRTFTDVSTSKSAYLLIYFSIFDSVSRPVAGHLCSLLPHRLIINGIESAITGINQIIMSIAILIIPFSTSYEMIAVCMSVIGLANGLNGVLCFPINSRLNKPSQLSHGVGLFHFTAGLGLMVGPPFAGFLSDSTGRMDVIFYFLSAVGFGSGFTCLLLFVLASKYGIRPKS